MKKKNILFTLFLAFSMVVLMNVNADACTLADNSQQVCPARYRMNYIKTGLAHGGNISGSSLLYGIGQRIRFGNSGLDLSYNIAIPDKHSDCFYHSFPRIVYLRYLPSNDSRHLYVGVGGSLGSIGNETKRRSFYGLVFEFCLGTEFYVDRPIHTFIELGISQGVIPIQKYGKFYNPSFYTSCGLGF